MATHPLAKIRREWQVRDKFDEESINGLASSLKTVGQLMPIRVRKRGNEFVVVDGERRFRAATKAEFSTIAAIVEERELHEGEILQRQLVANCQRVDLTPMEKARSIHRLMESTGWNAAETASKLGMSPPSVAKLLALLSLPFAIIEQVESGKISASAAYEIAKVEDREVQADLAKEAAKGGLTRDAIKGRRKRAESGQPPTESTKLSRAVVTLGAGRSVTVAGADLSLESMITWLEELLGKARKARTQAWELSTFVRALRDQSKA
ncbi:MAG: ParB/RepB/Spo0J family partition protein [Planctomycetota bacterium]